MSSGDRGVPKRAVQDARARSPEGFAVLQECLIGGDVEQLRRERRLRRRSLMISTLLQTLVVLAIVAIPFFGNVQRIAMANVMPLPPYHPRGMVREHAVVTTPTAGQRATFCYLCPTAHPNRPMVGGGQQTTGENLAGEINGFVDDGLGRACSECLEVIKTPGPPPPPPLRPSLVHLTHVDPAMLIKRIEPFYPPLAQQTRRAGRVELHAIISADGRIESLEVVSGDVLFYQSALDAVQRWIYRPTFLNGQAVKVDTYITVVYTMQQN
jgi:TonB family protein